MTSRLIIRLLPLGLVPIGAIVVVAGLVYVGVALWSTDDGGPTYRVANGRVVDDLDAIQASTDFGIVEPPHELIPWPLWQVRGSGSQVSYWYRSDQGSALQVRQRRIDREGSERGELIVHGTDVHRVVNEESSSILLHWVDCGGARFDVSTGLDDEDIALEVVAAMVEQCA
jgi:hypothetical protein